METFLRSRVPWEAGPNLKELTDEVGIDMDRFVESIGANKTDVEMASEFGVSQKTIQALKEHFYSRGIGSTIGQD
ncbi:helix-turn-helix domain-containing protein [Phosphitispora sp. TUW77]|uniref:helix-turn-helix domain-containing protein n=1 Tax=Phosphitispora sp. TUW77 TaxID=3152361 RepID=UPI003AB508DC